MYVHKNLKDKKNQPIKKAKENVEEESPKCLGPVRNKLISVTQCVTINFKNF